MPTRAEAHATRLRRGESGAGRALGRLVSALWVCCAACGGSSSPEPAEAPSAPLAAPPVVEPGAVRRFAFPTLDGTVVSSESLRGRLTVIGLLASYDPPSQAQALILRALARDHAPRVNVLVVMLEPEEARPMIDAFVHALDAPFPAVLGDAEAIAGRAPFPGLHEVPSLVVLDAEGRELWRHAGQLDEQQLDAVLRELESRAAGARPR